MQTKVQVAMTANDFLISDWLIFLHVKKYRIFTSENIWIFPVAEILIKHWCLYNKQI